MNLVYLLVVCTHNVHWMLCFKFKLKRPAESSFNAIVHSEGLPLTFALKYYPPRSNSQIQLPTVSGLRPVWFLSHLGSSWEKPDPDRARLDQIECSDVFNSNHLMIIWKLNTLPHIEPRLLQEHFKDSVALFKGQYKISDFKRLWKKKTW